MCFPKVPDPPSPPAQRQAMKAPEIMKQRTDSNAQNRRRGYAALMGARPALQPPVTTATLGG